jgi:hypothetical protein
MLVELSVFFGATSMLSDSCVSAAAGIADLDDLAYRTA